MEFQDFSSRFPIKTTYTEYSHYQQFLQKNPERKCSENLYFCCLNNFENFKYPKFVWCNNFTYDNSFIFHPQCHALASLFLNMPRYTLALFFPFSLLNQSGPAEQLVASPILHSWGNEFDASPVPYFRED